MKCNLLDTSSITQLDIESEPIMISGDLTMIKRCISDIKLDCIDDAETTLMLQTNDIIPCKYEGGFKTWECCIDLTRYLMGQEISGKILELGCGSGIPGIYCLMQGAHVTFQDFNYEVLRYSTYPNAMLNMDKRVKTDFANGIFEHSLSKEENMNAEFWAGDWSSLFQKWDDSQYDYILSSETIYDSSSYGSLTDLVNKTLKQGGKLLIAAKYQYFGCSGSLNMFLYHLKTKYPAWKISTVMESPNGVRRQVVQVIKE